MEQRYSSTLSLTLALYEGGWSMPCPGRFTPHGRPGTHCKFNVRAYMCVCVYIYIWQISNDLQDPGPDRQKQMTLLFVS